MASSSRRPTRPEHTVIVALGVTVALALAKVATYLATSSLAVLSQALDSVLDIVALAVVYVGVRIAAKPADDSHHYGHGKAENIVALLQTFLIGVIVVGIAAEAVARLGDDDIAIRVPWYALALFVTSIAVDAYRVRMLTRAARAEGSEALRAGALNFSTDIATSFVALVSLGLVRLGLDEADAIGGLIVAVAIAWAAFRLGRRSVDVLMDRAPAVGAETIARAATLAPGVSETRRVRVRSSGGKLFADVTVAAGRTASLERAHDIAEGVEGEIARVAPGADVVVHVEPAAETGGLIERVQATASRVEGVHEVHNVSVHAFEDAGRTRLHVTLHAKVAPGTSVKHAHDLSDAIEELVRADLGDDVRVDTHIEPLEATALGRDVTAERAELVQTVIDLARREPDVSDCHEVLVTESTEGLSVVAHVRGRADLALRKIHEASVRIENGVKTRHPEVGSILIHFEPA
jgi:cation diffusion facilitator family transporter